MQKNKQGGSKMFGVFLKKILRRKDKQLEFQFHEANPQNQKSQNKLPFWVDVLKNINVGVGIPLDGHNDNTGAGVFFKLD